MKGKINKVVTFVVVIGLIISMAIIKNITTIKMSKQNIEVQPVAAAPIGHINNFMQRFYTYDALIGKDASESVWTFWDTEKKESDRIKNVYCVQTGKSANNNTAYDIYDAYNIDEATIQKYFGDAAHYRHFLYILENMFLVGRTGNDRQYMINSTNEKLNKYYPNSNYGTLYNNMIGEVNGLDMAGNYNGRVDAKYSGTNNENIQFNVWSSLTGSPVYKTYTDPINRVDNYLAIIQRYLLLSNVKQKDTNNYGTNPVSAGYKWNFFKAVYPYGYKSQGTVGGNSQNYADGLLKMLDEGFNNNTYDINKYKNFNANNTYVNTENAVYDSATKRAGPFTVVNPNGYSITPNSVKFGNENKTFTVVDADGNEVTLSSKTTGTEFYIQLDETLDNSNSLSINFYIDFGDVTTARLLIPTKANGQLMATVDRKHQDKNNTWTTKIEVKPDIALKKYIYAVNGSVAAVPARISDIDLSPLANGTSTNANYNMNKTPVKVQVGDTVTYAIQLFNEGRVNGTADEITDYLPSNLTFVRAYTDFDAVHAPGYDGSNDIANTGSNDTVKLSNPNADYIAPYEDTDTKETFMAKSQIIYIDCKVGVSGNGYVYTNMAEISKYRMEAGSDVDSTASNWSAPSQDRASQGWQDYSNGHSSEDPSWFDDGFHNWGAQDNNGAGDDDDFDKIIIDHVDLALTKRIEGKLVDGTEEYLVPDESSTNKSRIEISGYDEVKNGTASDLRYNMNKKVAHVQKEDKLVTVLTVYNEGKIDGTVRKITDYVPNGLNYNATETTALNSPNTTFSFNSSTRELEININGEEGILLQNLNDYDNDPSNHKVDHFEVKIVFDVSKTASGTIYNSAAITDYGYVGNDNTYYEAKELGVDKDSHGNENGDSLTATHYEAHVGAATQPTVDFTQFDKNNLQFEDDDDMDLVEVDYNPNFDLSLRKYIQKVEKKFDVPIDESNPSSGTEKYSTVYENRVPRIDEFSVRALNARQTAEYFHDKLRVVAENGDLVTYRIRVYNEGKDDDCYGRATEITDYLPSGLEFVSLESGNDAGWSASSDGNKVVLTYSADKKLPTNSIDYLAKIARAKEIKERIDNGEDVSAEDVSFYNTYGSLDEHNLYQEVGVICRVTANDDFKIVTNRAAITGREAYKKVYDSETEYHLEYDSTIQDRDNSENDELYSNDVDAMHNNLDIWYRTHVYNETTPDEYYPGDEDDDDFDSIYVYNYDLTIRKTDGTNLLPGTSFKVIKYRAKSAPRRDYYDGNLVELATIQPQVELTDVETSINTTGEGTYETSAPVSEVENDVYIIKEIQGVDGYYNPFEGKYIKVSFRGIQDEVHANFSFLNMVPQYLEIYTDNGDDDYTNDQYITDNFRDPANIYKYAYMVYPGIGRHFEINIKNNELEVVKGKYTVRLTKYGIDEDENEEQIAGVQFNANGKFNGGNTMNIPRAGAQIVSSATEYVTVLPESYTDGFVEIDPDNYETPDEINIVEAGISSSAVDGQGRPINKKYYTGLLGKELKIKVNKECVDFHDEFTSTYTRTYQVESLELALDGQTFTGEKTLDNGSKVVVSKGSSYSGVIIDVKMYNPAITPSGDYSINLSKVGTDAPNTLVPGVEFEASAVFNGTEYDIPSSSTNLVTGSQPVNVMPTTMSKIDIDPDEYETPDYITLKEKGFANTAEGNAAKAKYHLALKDKEIKVTINKDVNDTDPMNPVYYVSSIGLTVDGSSANITGSGYSWTYTEPTTGAKVEVSYNTTTRNINVKVSNPLRQPEGSYTIYLTKTGTNGRQLGGVQFDAEGELSGTNIDIPNSTDKLTTSATAAVAVMPATMSEINIDPDEYQTPDKITLEETGIENGAVDSAGDSVDAKYYLGFKNKEVEITINKNVDKTDSVIDRYYVESISVKLDGTAVPAKSGVANTYEYVDTTTGATLTVSLNTQTNRIDIVMSNPTKTHEGEYSINIKKMATNGRQLGGVEFDTTGHFNGTNYPETAGQSYTVTTSKTTTVDMLPSSFNNKVEIDENHYTDADIITFEESGYATGAVDDQGTAVAGNYYLALDGKKFELTINKSVNHQETKDIYYVSSLGLKVNGSTNNITGSGFSYTYDDPDSEASVTVAYNENTKTISVVATNVPIEREGTYHVKLIKYKQGSNTAVSGVKFTADAKIDDVQETIADQTNPLVTGTTAINVKENATMSEEKIQIVDRYVLKEIDVGNNSDIFIGYTGNITLNVEKDMDTSNPAKKVFYVKKIWLTLDDQNNSSIQVISDYKSTVTLPNGTKIEIEYNTTTKTIEIRVTDPVKEGSFKVNLIKRKYNVDENNDGKDDPLQGAVFSVKINDGTSDIINVQNQTTNANGEIPTIDNIEITAENLTYTITVTEVSAPTGYIGIGAPVTFTAKSKFDGAKYVLDTTSQPTIGNEYVQAEVSENEIAIEAENRVEPVIHKGVKTVENQDSGYDKNEIQTWVINSTVPSGIADYTKYVVTDTIDPEKTNISEKRIEFLGLETIHVSIKGTQTELVQGVDYLASFDDITKTITLKFIDGEFKKGQELPEDSVLEITFNTKFTLYTEGDKKGDPIGLNQRIPNKAKLIYNGNGSDEDTKESEEPEVHTGGLGVYKYDKSTNQALVGAKFRLTRTRAEAEAAVDALWAEDQAAIDAIDWVKKYNADGTEGEVWEVTTGSDGYAYFAGLEFGGDASDDVTSNATHNGKGGSLTYEYDWENASTMYYLVETYVPEDYILLKEVAADCEVKYNNFAITDLTTYHKVGNEVVVEEGEYAIELVKYGKYEGEDLHPIAGVVFSAKRTINGAAEEDLGNLTETDSTGRTIVSDAVTIERSHVSTNDVYKIREVSIPEESEYYIGLDKEIVLTVSKQSVKSDDKTKWLNSVAGINMSIEGETVTEVTAGKKYTAKVVKDGQELEITAELLADEQGGQYIKLTVENPHKTGKFPLNIIKTIKGTNPARYLAGAGFKISIKQGGNYVKTTAGEEINGTREYHTGGNGRILIDDIDIRKPGLTYDIEIEETTVPPKYIGLGEKVTYQVTSIVKGNKLSLQDGDEIVLTNDVLVNVENGEIWNYIENKPEPEIHKGVKTVENQDAGYDGDEIQTWVINSTVPAGIEDYTKYVITDTIDQEIVNNDEKRIEFLGLDTIHVSIKGLQAELTQGEDYLASFDDTTKTITIKFIDGEFKKGQELPENSVLEVTFNTKFRLDSNGLIIGLNQSIPNQAHLTFNGNGKDEKERHSETPEVHTGAVGVLKFEDVNKNGIYDKNIDYTLKDAHFKIVKTKEEADKALAAVLAGDEDTLSTINFVKERDEEGNITDVDVELITTEDGTATYEGLAFGGDAEGQVEQTTHSETGAPVYVYDWNTAKSTYYLVETVAPYDYYLLDRYEAFDVSKDSFVRLNLNTYYKEADKPKIYDLSLRKFITHVNGTDVEGNEIDRNITDRIPQVTLTDEFKDKENEKVTTAEYKHTKDPVIVQQGNIVTYTIRVYNEGPEDAYAAIVKDDIPDGVIFVPYTQGDGSVNDEYRWKIVDENDKEVTDTSKAKYIVTDYLSKEQGEIKNGVNENLIKGFDSDTMKELDYRDLKVQFLVVEPNTSERIITNYAQVAKMTNSDGYDEDDRDSTPNEWIEGEDDQDIENIRLLYFDLALRKWVTKAIVTTDGEQKVFETGHKAEDDPEDVVKVDLKKSKLDKVVVKFEYQIRITNQGRIGGWCEEITDHIPDGLVFEQADNPIWTVVNDKTIVTDALKDTYLEPGESAEVTVVLRWVNSGDNLGIKVNVAEISKDRNEYGVHDIDSTPGNYKWGEDDIDDAPVMLAVTTGNRALECVILGLVVVSIIAIGAIAIKKVRNEK